MGKNRLFIPQETMDQWVDVDHAVVQDNELCLADDGRVYQLAPAVLFLREATGAEDPHDLVGRVKEDSTLTILGADAYMDSVILEDNAYDVCRGFVAVPAIAPARKDTLPPPTGIEADAVDAESNAELSSPPDIIDEPPRDSALAPIADEAVALSDAATGDSVVLDDLDELDEQEEDDELDEQEEDDELDEQEEVAELDEQEEVAELDEQEEVDELDEQEEVDELEDLSHELEDFSEDDEHTTETVKEETVAAPRNATTMANGSEEDEEDDVLAKLLLKSLK